MSLITKHHALRRITAEDLGFDYQEQTFVIGDGGLTLRGFVSSEKNAYVIPISNGEVCISDYIFTKISKLQPSICVLINYDQVICEATMCDKLRKALLVELQYAPYHRDEYKSKLWTEKFYKYFKSCQSQYGFNVNCSMTCKNTDGVNGVYILIRAHGVTSGFIDYVNNSPRLTTLSFRRFTANNLSQSESNLNGLIESPEVIREQSVSSTVVGSSAMIKDGPTCSQKNNWCGNGSSRV
jgi:hypothetical protein